MQPRAAQAGQRYSRSAEDWQAQDVLDWHEATSRTSAFDASTAQPRPLELQRWPESQQQLKAEAAPAEEEESRSAEQSQAARTAALARVRKKREQLAAQKATEEKREASLEASLRFISTGGAVASEQRRKLARRSSSEFLGKYHENASTRRPSLSSRCWAALQNEIARSFECLCRGLVGRCTMRRAANLYLRVSSAHLRLSSAQMGSVSMLLTRL